jgi:hypothetical protein
MANSHLTGNHTTHTVSDYLKDYTLITKSLEALTAGGYIAEELFTGGFNAQGGGIQYMESVNKYVDVDADPEDFAVAEGSAPHQVYSSDVGPQRAPTKKYYIEGWVTYEEERWNQLGALARLLKRMSNTMVRELDTIVMNMLRTNNKIRNYTCLGAWATPTYANLYDDIIEANAMVENEVTAGDVYNANTLVISKNTHTKILRNTSVRDLFGERPDNPRFTGEMERIAGLNMLVTPYMADDMAFILEKGAIGGIADEEPFQVKPIEDDKRREKYFIRIKRRTVAFLSDPGAIVRLDITP